MQTIPPTDAFDLLHKVPLWRIGAGSPARIERKWTFPDYVTALEFVGLITAIAETKGHHPDVCFGWGYVTLSLTTREAGGLTLADFELAEAIDHLAA